MQIQLQVITCFTVIAFIFSYFLLIKTITTLIIQAKTPIRRNSRRKKSQIINREIQE